MSMLGDEVKDMSHTSLYLLYVSSVPSKLSLNMEEVRALIVNK